jgi:3-isopropylmalate dehydratase
MAAAAAMTGHLTDVRKFVEKGAALTSHRSRDPVEIKTLSSLDFLTDPVLPPPTPQPLPEQTTAHPVAQASIGDSDDSLAFRVLKGIAAPLEIENVDTDMIIPKQFLKTIKRTGLAKALFWTLRVDPYTGKSTDFVLNRSPYDQAKILVCIGQNFGCGSSREHAAWSL